MLDKNEKKCLQPLSLAAQQHVDNVAEWLRRQPAKLMGFARVGSNPTVVAFLTKTKETAVCGDRTHALTNMRLKHAP